MTIGEFILKKAFSLQHFLFLGGSLIPIHLTHENSRNFQKTAQEKCPDDLGYCHGFVIVINAQEPQKMSLAVVFLRICVRYFNPICLPPLTPHVTVMPLRLLFLLSHMSVSIFRSIFRFQCIFSMCQKICSFLEIWLLCLSMMDFSSTIP